jgi:hypothetical protein
MSEWVDYVYEKASTTKLAELTLEIMRFESGGNPEAKNPYSSAYGLCQIIDSTWKRYSLEGEHRDNWEHQIDVCLRILDGGSGIKHWPQFYTKYHDKYNWTNL